MPKDINYYPGQTLGKEELQFKDYADKYMSMYVDLIRSGAKDVLFVKDATDFAQSKGTGSPENLIVAGGYCLFNKLSSAMTDFDYKSTLNADNFIDQKFFVRSAEKTIATTVIAGSYPTTRYAYLESYVVPAAFECTVGTDGTLTTADGGSIKKSELTSILRGSSSNAPTRVRFINPNYTKTSIVNTGVYEISEVISEDTITLTQSMAAETIGTVLCVPIGSFNLGTDNNLENRAMFCYTETDLYLSETSNLDDSDGIIKICELTYSSGTAYDIVDLRQSNKYAITIDVEIDLSDFVTKSTTQTVSGSKAFTNLIQGKITNLTKASNWQANYIVLNETTGNEIIFDCGSAQTTIAGFKHVTKSWGTNPDINLVVGTAIRVRFANVGASSVFSSMYTGAGTLTAPIVAGVLYTIRAEEIGDFTYFSVSPTASHKDVLEMTARIEQNETDIASIEGRVTVNEGDISTVEAVAAANEVFVSDVVVRQELFSSSDTRIYLSAYKKGGYYNVTITALMKASLTDTSVAAGTVPAAFAPFTLITNAFSSDRSIFVSADGSLIVKNNIATKSMISVSYCTGIEDLI